MSKDAMTQQKIEDLIHYLKAYNIRDAVTLGIIFRMCVEEEVVKKGIYLSDLAFITEEPLLIIGYDQATAPTEFTYKGMEYASIEDIFNVLRSLDEYFVYVSFPGNIVPNWHLEICEPNPFIKDIGLVNQLIGEVEKELVFHEDFKVIYKEALMVLIDNALDTRDRDQFFELTREWAEIE